MEDFNRVTRLELRIAKLEEQACKASIPVERCQLHPRCCTVDIFEHREQCVLKRAHNGSCTVAQDLCPGTIPRKYILS